MKRIITIIASLLMVYTIGAGSSVSTIKRTRPVAEKATIIGHDSGVTPVQDTSGEKYTY